MALKSPIQVIAGSSLIVTTGGGKAIPTSTSGGKFIVFTPLDDVMMFSFGETPGNTFPTLMQMPGPVLLNLNGQSLARKNVNTMVLTPLENH